MDPAYAPDFNLLFADDVPDSFRLRVLRDGDPVDLSQSILTAVVADNGLDIGEALIDATDADRGELVFTIPVEVYASMKTYATLRFHESLVFDRTLMMRRLVKARRSSVSGGTSSDGLQLNVTEKVLQLDVKAGEDALRIVPTWGALKYGQVRWGALRRRKWGAMSRG